MTAQIKATCPECGEIDLTAPDVTLMLCSVAPLSYYVFDCVNCVQQIRKPADERVVALLRTGGVPIQHWVVPAEALEAKAGPQLVMDDVLDFALGLAGTDLLADLARADRVA